MATGTENEELVERDVTEVWNGGNVGAIDELYAEDFTFHYPGRPPMDRDAFTGFVSGFRSAVPDLDVRIEATVAEGDSVLCRFTESGTHEGELMGIPATGEGFETTGMILYRIDDGAIAEAWVNDDGLGMLHQIGAFVDPTGASGSTPSVVPEPDGQALWSVGALQVVKADAETTGGAFALIEQVVPPGYETPYHVHHAEDELFYILDGEIDCYYGENGEEALPAEPRDTVFLPRDVPHGFRVVSDHPCRMLVGLAPAGLEEFFAEAGRPAGALEPPPPAEPDLEALAALAGDYQLEILGPVPD